MSHLFRRLTAMFWFLFLGVICAFGINFYSRYEETYQDKMHEYDLITELVTSQLNNDLNLYERVVDVAVQIYHELFKENYNTILQSSVANLKKFDEYKGLEGMPEKDLRNAMAIRKTNSQINILLSMMIEFYNGDHVMYDFKIVPHLKQNEYHKNILSENEIQESLEMMEYYENSKNSSHYIWIKHHSNNNIINYFSTLIKPVIIEDEILGYITLDLGTSKSNAVSTTPGEKSMYYYYDVFYASDAEVTSVVNQYLEEDKLTEAIDYLSDTGHYVGYSKSENQLVTLIYYLDKNKLHVDVLSQTVRLFELNLIILIILFLSVSYILFISIIKPCYLLVGYVRQCGEGNYEIPPSINNEWRLPFVTIRNAYLENERLLTVKENQSQELEYAWKKAMVANQAKTHFLAKVSHELRTPLNAIRGYVQLLKITVDDEKHLKKINIIERSSDLLLNIVTELLDFSRIEEGKIKLNIQEMNLMQIADLLQDMFINDTQAKDLEYCVVVDHLIPNVLYGDESRIKQIIINLVSNAVKFTDQGSINVLFKLDNIDKEYAYIEVKVSDTGKGISSNKLMSIFESFTQENNSISRKYGGTGLGLSISKGLTEVMGGSLNVESEVGVGSTFTFFLPLSLNPILEDEN